MIFALERFTIMVRIHFLLLCLQMYVSYMLIALFFVDTLRAIALLVAILPTNVAHLKRFDAKGAKYLQDNKDLLSGMPSCALLQIAPVSLLCSTMHFVVILCLSLHLFLDKLRFCLLNVSLVITFSFLFTGRHRCGDV